MKKDNRPIGIFDSGLGGLTVVAALRSVLPHEDIVYLGDSARVPYGNKSVENIKRFGAEDCKFLLKKGVKTIIVACNTVSAVAISDLKSKFTSVPILDVLTSGVSACIRENPEYVAVIGTRATVNSDAYRMQIHKIMPEIAVKSIACPLFVPLAEEGLTEGPITASVIEHYLGELLSKHPDLLLLGCTHYPLLKKYLRTFMPEPVKIIDSAIACAEFAAEYIKENKLLAGDLKKGEERYYVTDMASDFYAQASRFLGYRIGHVEKVSL